MILLFLQTSESPHCDIICTVRANAGVKVRQILMKISERRGQWTCTGETCHRRRSVKNLIMNLMNSSAGLKKNHSHWDAGECPTCRTWRRRLAVHKAGLCGTECPCWGHSWYSAHWWARRHVDSVTVSDDETCSPGENSWLQVPTQSAELLAEFKHYPSLASVLSWWGLVTKTSWFMIEEMVLWFKYLVLSPQTSNGQMLKRRLEQRFLTRQPGCLKLRLLTWPSAHTGDVNRYTCECVAETELQDQAQLWQAHWLFRHKV